jgi:5-formyltetrahydrofolate cyclo-ligase
VSEEKNPRPYSSPACLLHELEELPQNWEEIKAWRTLRRRERIMQRLGRDPSERRRLGRIIVDRLVACLDRSSYPVLGIYSPIRGEVDVREIAHRHIAAGGQVALPVVVKKAAPVEFWRWSPGMRMQRGLWNIPIPREREVVTPEALLVPMVGFDRARYRLGYGGGYYDRTLAAAVPRPHTIGVAYADSSLATIHPQSHDIPLNLIVTD